MLEFAESYMQEVSSRNQQDKDLGQDTAPDTDDIPDDQ